MSDSQSDQRPHLLLALLLALLVMMMLGVGGYVWYRYSLQPPELQWAYNDPSEFPKAQQALTGEREDSPEALIQQVLEDQLQAWNTGQVDEFMESYWKSEDLTFSSGGKITRGWQATHDRYKKKYSSREQMGQLTFRDLEISPLAEDVALVLGEWKLVREADELGGNFSLVFRRLDGEWLIVHDHTSSNAKSSE